jgi:hypothetical protein
MNITYGNFLTEYINNSLFFEKIDKILYLHDLEKQYANPNCLIISKQEQNINKVFCFSENFYVVLEKENDKIVSIDVIVCNLNSSELGLIQSVNESSDVSANTIYYLLNTLLLFKKQDLKFYNETDIRTQIISLFEKVNTIENILQKSNDSNIVYSKDKNIVDNLKIINDNLSEFINNVNPALVELNKSFTKEFVNNLFLG